MFFDASLSASGKQSCSTCHDPRFAYGPPPDLTPGRRAAPSLRYLQSAPQFTEHYFDAETTGDDSVDNGPTGGLTWDGRVDRGRDQARIPLLSAEEMANENPAAVVRRAMRAGYAPELRRLSHGNAFDTILEALEDFEQDPREFYPYSSKYDLWLGGKASLTDMEQRGLRLFADPGKGNCAQCHPATKGVSGKPPQFTDFGMIAIGVPRNSADSKWLDLGLCGPERTDFGDRPDYCGRFRTPSLRNAATRSVFFHNGAAHSLRDAIEFYVKRDPEKSDLPPKYRMNLETGPPFPAHAGDKPALTDIEIDDIAEFLRTLTDADVAGHS